MCEKPEDEFDYATLVAPEMGMMKLEEVIIAARDQAAEQHAATQSQGPAGKVKAFNYVLTEMDRIRRETGQYADHQ
jgi:hypothetical protein